MSGCNGFSVENASKIKSSVQTHCKCKKIMQSGKQTCPTFDSVKYFITEDPP